MTGHPDSKNKMSNIPELDLFETIYIRSENGSTVHDQFKFCIYNLNHLLLHLNKTFDDVLKINVFLDTQNVDFIEFNKWVKEQIEGLLNNKTPVAVISQSPEPPDLIALEVLIIKNKENSIVSKENSLLFPYVIIKSNDYKIIVSSVSIVEDAKIKKSLVYQKAFEYVEKILDRENMCYANIIRQWNYIGDILGKSNHNDSEIQNYLIFNEVRASSFKNHGLNSSYPAATGIGMKAGSIVMDFIAIASNEKITIESLSNPAQTDAYFYSDNIISEDFDIHKLIMIKPMFERAKLVLSTNALILFLSGTASIRNQETIGIGNVSEQTKHTIDNVRYLLNTISLRKINKKNNLDLNLFNLIKVYVKNREHIPEVKSICEKNFQKAHAIYLVSDICRENLLVEIEGVLYKSFNDEKEK